MGLEINDFNTDVDSVIVYQTGVQITQKGSINLKNGEQLLTITDLPKSLDKESVRVKGLGAGKIVNINIEFNSKKEYSTEDRKSLQEEKEKLEKVIKKNEIDLVRVKEQIENYKSTEDVFYQDFPKSFAFGEVNMDKFIEFNDKINDVIKSKMELIETFEDKIKELRIELQVIRNKISKLEPVEKIRNFYEITINLNVIKDGEFIIEIRYTLSEAWWVPFYDITLSEAKARLNMMANVYNRTGMDWENVEIEISTASLKPISLIKPNPMILEEYIPRYYEKKGEKKMAKGRGLKMAAKPMELKEDMDVKINDYAMTEEEVEEELPEIEETRAEVSENIGIQSFKIPSRINIPSDKNPHPINLTVQELESEKKYYWSCVAPENIIIKDTLINEELLLLAGNVKIYYLEEFIGETSISTIAPKEKFKLGTRVSYDLKINKKLIDRSKDKKAIKGKLKNNYEYKILIKNLNDIEEELTILDRVPHSSSENIKVEIIEISPKPDKQELGILKWKFNLKGIRDKTIEYKYYIEYKKDITITPSLP
ncbi:MAG: mucoidy inhibitor MuiA family protein [Promethearchaeota archaeon]